MLQTICVLEHGYLLHHATKYANSIAGCIFEKKLWHAAQERKLPTAYSMRFVIDNPRDLGFYTVEFCIIKGKILIHRKKILDNFMNNWLTVQTQQNHK